MPTVSIIIPVYKAEHYLDACMCSVVGQSCTDLEILLVDDGSPDRSPEMCDAWAARDPRVRVLHRKNGGAASARNAGLDAATGDFIFFADADDLLEPDAIEYLVKAEQQYGTDLVIGNMLYVDAENHPMAEPDFTGFTDTVRTVDEVWEHYFALDNRKVYYVVVWNKLYKRAMFDTLRFRDGKRYEDQFFMLDVLRRCQTVACLGYQGYRYVQHSASTMAVAGVASNYLERPEYLLEWSRYFAEKGNYLRAEGLLNDAIENLSQKENFDLSTQRQQARYHELRHSCAEVYRLLSHRTGRESMLLRAGLIHLGLPVYLAFLRERRSSAQTPPAAPQWRTPAPLTPVPAVSIIIPVYKVERYLDTCVQSVLDQTFQGIEVLLVDDGSPDRCSEMCDAWAKSDRRVRVIHRKNGGLSAARNTGIETARGRYIVFVDSDDFLEPDTIRRAVAEQERTGAELVIFNLVYTNDRGERWPTPDFTIFQDEILDEDGVWARYFALENQKIYYTVAWNKLYTAKLFADGLRFPEGKRYEDQFMLPHILHRCQNIACLGYQGYRYVQRADSIMAQGPASHYLDRPEYLLEWCGYFTEKGDYLRAEGLLNDAIKNLAEKDGFDLTTAQQRTRYRQACHDCSTAYGNLSRRTGRESMLLRAGLLRLGLPLYRIFLKHKT